MEASRAGVPCVGCSSVVQSYGRCGVYPWGIVTACITVEGGRGPPMNMTVFVGAMTTKVIS